MINKAKIAEIAGHVRAANGAVTFIIGAGASKSAGIPLAKDLIKQIEADFSHCCVGLAEYDRANYGKLMSMLSPAERERLIAPLLRNAKLNWGHIALATLLRAHLVQRVLTFNFDLVLESAASMLGVHVPVYDFGVAPTRDVNRVVKPSIVHLHGQSHGMVLLNTDEETQSHCNNIRPLLADSLRNSLTIVFGYSGEADAAFKVIETEYNDYHRLIWCGFGDTPPGHLKNLLNYRYFEYVGGCDFDRTMLELAQELKVWPPLIIENPMRHTLQVLASTTNFPVGTDDDKDFLIEIRRMLEAFALRWKDEQTADSKAFDAALGLATPHQMSAINPDDLSKNAKSALAWALLVEGNELVGDGGDTTANYAAACDKYERAVALKPDMHEAFYNWGNALLDEAKKLTSEAAEAKFAAAYDKYERAVAIKPDMHEAFHNWGNALLDEAKTLTGEAAAAKFAAAYDKYERAVAIKPDKHETFSMWGAALSQEAETLTGEAAAAKFAAAYDKYERAVALKPDMHEAFYNWGTALLVEAETLTGKSVDPKFAAAQDRFERAAAIKPDKWEAFSNWGTALSQEAMTLTGEAAAAKFAAAYDKYERAVAIKPDKYELFNNWVATLLDEAKMLTGEAAAAKYAEASVLLERCAALTEQSNYNLACLYAVTGEIDAAIKVLEECSKHGALPDSQYLDADSDLDSLRQHPRYVELRRQLGDGTP
jgi:tetratricopeptide (TPR) repeat protein